MFDDQKFMNVYVENAVGTVHEYINVILQLKTKLKIASDMVQQKDEMLSSFQSELANNKAAGEEINEANRKARSWEEQYNAMKNKMTHMDTLTNQYNDLKKLYVEREREIANLTSIIDQKEQEIVNLKSEKDTEMQVLKKELNKLPKEKSKTPPKKVINTKNTVKELNLETEEKIDDF